MTGFLVPERKGNRTIYQIDMGRLEEYRRLENEMYRVITEACADCASGGE
jgi:hypothetical protein